MDNKETAKIFTPKIKTIILYLFLFIGIIIILREYIGGRSLWVDEAMVALNMPRSFKELLQPLAYNQTAPLLFLYFCKFFTILFRISDYSLRIVPLIFGLGAYVVYFFISKKIFNNFTGIIISLALYLSSYNLIYYSNEFKPYSADVFFSLLFFLFFYLIRTKGINLNKGVLITALGLAAVWISYEAIFVLVVFTSLLLIYSVKEKNKYLIIFTITSGILWLVNILWEYFLIYKRDPNFVFVPLLSYWSSGFMPFPPKSLLDIIWLPRTILEFFRFITFSDFIFIDNNIIFKNLFAGIFIILTIYGIFLFFKSKKGYIATYLLFLSFLQLFLSGFKKIPFGGRLSLYIVPIILLSCAIAISNLVIHFKKINVSIAIIFLLLIFIFPFISRFYHLFEPTYKIEMKSVVNYYKSHKEKDDKVFLEINGISYYPPSYLFYYNKGWDFTNKKADNDTDKNLDELKTEILGYDRVWVIGEIGELKQYGKLLDRYKLNTLASKWPFKFLEFEMRNFNTPGIEIALYDFRVPELESLIQRFYEFCNNTEPKKSDSESWSRALITGDKDIMDMSNYFINNNSMPVNYSDEDFIKILYKIYFNRTPDKAGFNKWLSDLKNKKINREDLIKNFIESIEFKNSLRDYINISSKNNKDK